MPHWLQRYTICVVQVIVNHLSLLVGKLSEWIYTCASIVLELLLLIYESFACSHGASWRPKDKHNSQKISKIPFNEAPRWKTHTHHVLVPIMVLVLHIIMFDMLNQWVTPTALFWIDMLNQRDHELLKLLQDAIIPQSVSSRRGLETWTPSWNWHLKPSYKVTSLLIRIHIEFDSFQLYKSKS